MVGVYFCGFVVRNGDVIRYCCLALCTARVNRNNNHNEDACRVIFRCNSVCVWGRILNVSRP